MDKGNLPDMNPERSPVVFTKNGEVFANSRDIAEVFGKEHKDVLRATDNLQCSSEFRQRNFALTVVREKVGATDRDMRSFDMTKDGFTFLVMGFTGEKAARFKERYIAAFNAMEAELRAAPRVMIDYTDPKVLLGVMSHLQEQIAEKDTKLEVQGQKLAKLVKIEASGGSLSFQETAKTLKLDPLKKMTGLLVRHQWIYKRVGNSNWLARQDKIRAGLLEHAEHTYLDSRGEERVATRARVTPKGLLAIAQLLIDEGMIQNE